MSEVKNDKKDDLLGSLIEKINRDAVRAGESAPFTDVSSLPANSYLPTGIQVLDEKLGGGFVRGVISLIWGEWHCGKTQVALACARETLDSGGTVVYLNTEHITQETLLEAGIDPNNKNFYLLHAEKYGDEALNIINKLLYDPKTYKNREVLDLILIDSITNLVPKAEVDSLEAKGIEGNSQLGRLAAMLTKWSTDVNGRNILGYGPKACACIAVSQMRANVGDQYRPTKQTGGNAISHNAKAIVKFYVSKKTKNKDGIPLGHDVNFVVEKQASGGVPSKGAYSIIYGEGIDDTEALFKTATLKNHIQKAARGTFLIYDLPNTIYKFDGKLDDFKSLIKYDNSVKKILRKVVKLKALEDQNFNDFTGEIIQLKLPETVELDTDNDI